MLEISLLGTGGMMPLHNRFLTSMAARLMGSMLLIDCGEGTQVTLKQLGWGFKSLDCICFTHFHADHISGLPGLLLTIGNSDRTEPLTLIGPRGLKRVVGSLCVIAPELPFELRFIELDAGENIVRQGPYTIKTLPLRHGIQCFGYSLSLARAGKFDVARAREQEIPLKLWSRLQKGEEVCDGEKLYTPDMVLGAERKGLKVSYITDSRPTDSIPDFIADSDLFICEGLYGDDEKKEKAIAHKHMIFSEAALLAQKGNVKEMWLTHYSPALVNPEEYIKVATDIFENSRVGYDRLTKELVFDEEE